VHIEGSVPTVWFFCSTAATIIHLSPSIGNPLFHSNVCSNAYPLALIAFISDPKKSPDGKSKTYYSIKDIYFLAHEPLLEKFREFKSFMKKVRRLNARKEKHLADKLHDQRPKYKLDHLVRERYPHFDDAVRDLDDALSMVHLFGRLPAEKKIGNVHPANCAKLGKEWQYYVAHSNTLRKVFVSIKGIYYQAEVRGEKITWLVASSLNISFSCCFCCMTPTHDIMIPVSFICNTGLSLTSLPKRSPPR
jgi:hypothetical protein